MKLVILFTFPMHYPHSISMFVYTQTHKKPRNIVYKNTYSKKGLEYVEDYYQKAAMLKPKCGLTPMIRL